MLIAGRSKSPSPSRGNRIDSPTPAADPDQGKPTTVAGIMGAPGSQRVKVSHQSRIEISLSFESIRWYICCTHLYTSFYEDLRIKGRDK